jgi:hypothetical protein
VGPRFLPLLPHKCALGEGSPVPPLAIPPQGTGGEWWAKFICRFFHFQGGEERGPEEGLQGKTKNWTFEGGAGGGVGDVPDGKTGNKYHALCSLPSKS